jgi:Tol biopolymer transport system component
MKKKERKYLLSICIIFCTVISGSFSGCITEGIIKSLPPNADVLFVSNRDTGTRRKEIYTLDIDSGEITRLTYSNKHFFIIGIDQTKRYIVASCATEDTDAPAGLGDEDKKSLWLFDLYTKEELLLSDPLNHAEGDSFSPDGKWIVFFMRLADEEQSDIYKINIDGSNLTKLTNTSNGFEADPCWSNTGQDIIFTYLDAETPRFVLKKMDSTGNKTQLVYDGGEGIATSSFPPGNFDPAWSPDDEWVVFERAVNYTGQNWGSGIWHIFKIRRDGTELADLSIKGNHTDRAEYLPSFSPDGLSIIYGSLYEAVNTDDSHVDLFMMDANNGNPTRLTTDSESNMFPIWIP